MQADVSARNVAVTSSFNGIEIVIFGAVDNSQQPSAESGYYDVLIVVEGVPGRIVVRRKNNVAGLWLNTSSATFDVVPSYYAIASTRPIDEITTEEFRASHGVGFQHLRFTPAFGQTQALSTEDLKEFREAIVRLKEKQGLYIQDNFSVAFIGKSLFRATIELPANVTVGPFETRVYLFREEKLLSQYTVRLNLEREGLERHLHRFAFGYPTLYGLMTVAIAHGRRAHRLNGVPPGGALRAGRRQAYRVFDAAPPVIPAGARWRGESGPRGREHHAPCRPGSRIFASANSGMTTR